MITSFKNMGYFVMKNESFLCAYCGEQNPKAAKTCRNHCRKCFCSQHLDAKYPGDRASDCRGKMKVVEIGTKKDCFIVVHKCERCQKEERNRIAIDDDFSELARLAEKIAEKTMKNAPKYSPFSHS